jgi:hypothetical protein
VVDAGLLDPSIADDRAALTEAAQLALVQFCDREASRCDREFRDILRSKLALTALQRHRPVSRRSDYSPLESNLLDRVGRRTTGLSLNDIADVVGDALKSQRKDILSHVGRMFRLQEVQAAPAHGEERFKSLHRRLVQVESEIRSLKKGG